MRIISLKDWLENDLLLDVSHFEPASSDASFRRYFRIATAGKNLIVMDAPPDKENILAFIKVAGLMSVCGVRVPEIYQQNITEGFLLLEDFGSHCLLDRLNQSTVKNLYSRALDCLFTLQSNAVTNRLDLNHYDRPLLERELAIFDEWFIQQHLNLEMPESLWLSTCEQLVTSALAQPVTCVHRDFHSRNLMVLAENQPGVIDFQDAVIGPITYDLVSLLRDCYVAWPDDVVDGFCELYYQKLLAEQLLNCSYQQFQRWFDWMGLQRHLKAIGIFSRLNLRDGKSHYLKDIPRTLGYVVRICSRYPEFSAFENFINQQILPVLETA